MINEVSKLLSALPPEAYKVFGDLVGALTKLAQKDDVAAMEQLRQAQRDANAAVLKRVARKGIRR